MSKKKPFSKLSSGKFLKPRVRRKEATAPVDDTVPRITNETVTLHREEVLSGARKYIYPLRHSRHKIVMITVVLLTAVLIGFMTYTLVSLYRLQSSSAFMYQITKVVPLPVAKVGSSFVSYEDYLFELRHYIHYFEKQQEVDFTTEQGKAQLEEQRKKSLDKVIKDAYVKKIARQKNISVSDKEIDEQIDILRTQNRLGTDNKVFEDVLQDYWGWTIADFRRSIKEEILANKVLRELDTETKTQADAAMAELKSGADFAAVAKKYSEDEATKAQGGELGFLVNKTDRNVPVQTVNALYSLEPGQYSEPINIGYGLEIVKNIAVQEGKVKGARIFFAYEDINKFLNDIKADQKTTAYIKVN